MSVVSAISSDIESVNDNGLNRALLPEPMDIEVDHDSEEDPLLSTPTRKRKLEDILAEFSAFSDLWCVVEVPNFHISELMFMDDRWF